MANSLQRLRETIAMEYRYVDKRPYSHNIISLALQSIARNYGKAEANEAIEDYNLEKLGWKKEEVNDG